MVTACSWVKWRSPQLNKRLFCLALSSCEVGRIVAAMETKPKNTTWLSFKLLGGIYTREHWDGKLLKLEWLRVYYRRLALILER